MDIVEYWDFSPITRRIKPALAVALLVIIAAGAVVLAAPIRDRAAGLALGTPMPAAATRAPVMAAVEPAATLNLEPISPARATAAATAVPPTLTPRPMAAAIGPATAVPAASAPEPARNAPEDSSATTNIPAALPSTGQGYSTWAQHAAENALSVAGLTGAAVAAMLHRRRQGRG